MVVTTLPHVWAPHYLMSGEGTCPRVSVVTGQLPPTTGAGAGHSCSELSVSSAGSGTSHQAVMETTAISDEERTGLKCFLRDLKNSRFELV